MPRIDEPELVGFDAEAALEAALETVEGPLYSFVEFTTESFAPLYVADETMAMYRDEDHMREHFERIHSYVNLDFAEIELFTGELLPVADEVRHKTTALDAVKIVRIYAGHHGLFVALDPDEPVVPLVRAIRGTIDDDLVGASESPGVEPDAPG